MVRAYFYGEPAVPASLEGLMGKAVPRGLSLTPYSFQIGWETLSVLRVGEGECLFFTLAQTGGQTARRGNRE